MSDAASADDQVLWQSERKALPSHAAGGGRPATARYKLTRSFLIFEAGLLSTREERVPVWALGAIDLRQSIPQTLRGVGDLRIRVLSNFATSRNWVTLESIEDPTRVRNTLDREIKRARLEHHPASQSQLITQADVRRAPNPVVAATATSSFQSVASIDLLMELHRRGLLGDAEFGALVAKSAAPPTPVAD